MAPETAHPPVQDPLGLPGFSSSGAWLAAQVAALALFTPLSWLLARLVWIYYFFGLFFFLVAGLLVGAIAFRIARPSRPIARSRLLRGIVQLCLATMVLTTVFEYRHFRDTVGLPPKFADARNAAVASGRAANEIQSEAAVAFQKHLDETQLPGGALGYILWSTRDGQAELRIESSTEVIHSSHAGWIWPVRTTAAFLLLAAGLWFALESLRSAGPVSNVLPEGEVGEEWE